MNAREISISHHSSKRSIIRWSSALNKPRLDVGKLAGFKYREIIKRLKQLGFMFDRQAAGSHEIWFNPSSNRYTTIPNHPGDMPEGTLRAILK